MADVSVLNTIGHDLVQSMVCVSVETFLVAVYSVLVFKATSLLCRKGRSSIPFFTLALLILMFIFALILWIIDLVNVVAETRITLVDHPELSMDTKYQTATEFIFRRSAAQLALFSYMSIMSDSLLIWGVYAFWVKGRERLVLLIPAATILASIISTVILSYCVARLGSEIELGTFQKPHFCRNIQTTTYCTTVATTAVGTLLIVLKNWRYRRSIKPILSGNALQSSTQVERVLGILAGTGTLYLFFFIAQMILSISAVNERVFARADLRFAAAMFDDMTSVIVGIYPTIIVILVYSQNTLMEPTAQSQVPQFGRDHTVTFERQVTVAESTDPYFRWKTQRRLRKNVNIELPELNSPSAYFLPSSPERPEVNEPGGQVSKADSTISSVGV